MPYSTLKFYISKPVNKIRCRGDAARFRSENWIQYQRYRTAVLRKLRRKYSPLAASLAPGILREANAEKRESSGNVWIYWAQGFANAPGVVKLCAASAKKQLGGGEQVSYIA